MTPPPFGANGPAQGAPGIDPIVSLSGRATHTYRRPREPAAEVSRGTRWIFLPPRRGVFEACLCRRRGRGGLAIAARETRISRASLRAASPSSGPIRAGREKCPPPSPRLFDLGRVVEWIAHQQPRNLLGFGRFAGSRPPCGTRSFRPRPVGIRTRPRRRAGSRQRCEARRSRPGRRTSDRPSLCRVHRNSSRTPGNTTRRHPPFPHTDLSRWTGRTSSAAGNRSSPGVSAGDEHLDTSSRVRTGLSALGVSARFA